MKNTSKKYHLKSFRILRGFTLVEMMVAMVLGLIVMAGVISIFISNQRVSTSNQAISDVQDEGRTAFEMITHDIREAGNTPCGAPASNTVIVVDNTSTTPDPNNVNNIASTPSLWWLNWTTPFQGYDGATVAPFVSFGTAVNQRVAGTDAFSSLLSNLSTSTPILGSNPTVTNGLEIPAGADPFSIGDVVIAFSPVQGAIFQVLSTSTGFSPSGTSSGDGVFYGVGCAVSGLCNCSQFLGGPALGGCQNAAAGGNAGKNSYTYGQGSELSKLQSVAWYIGNNSVNTTSLFRIVLQNVNGVITPTPQEIVRNVTSFSVTYQPSVGANFVNPSAITNWNGVDSVQITLILGSTNQKASITSTPITRSYTATTTLRSRVN